MEIPTAAIYRLQSFIREAGSAPSPSPAAAPAPPFPSVAAFDSDASPELRCGRCGTAGGLLCGAQSAVCVYCGCPRLEEGGGVAFRDSAAYRWLLGSLGLDGSELVGWNAKYRDKFGFVSMICASGKTAREVLAKLKYKQELQLRDSSLPLLHIMEMDL